MKVMCINDKLINGQQHRILRYGEFYSPIGEGVIDGIDSYLMDWGGSSYNELTGKLTGGAYYSKSRFIPISEISETEMERNYNELLTNK